MAKAGVAMIASAARMAAAMALPIFSTSPYWCTSSDQYKQNRALTPIFAARSIDRLDCKCPRRLAALPGLPHSLVGRLDVPAEEIGGEKRRGRAVAGELCPHFSQQPAVFRELQRQRRVGLQVFGNQLRQADRVQEAPCDTAGEAASCARHER